MRCRHCATDLKLPFVDLGTAPPSNAYLTEEENCAPEKWYPLRLWTCTQCWLVQTEDYAHFSDFFSANYAYFSSFSSTWLQHAKRYVDGVTERFSLDENSLVVEIASNDGYLLQYFQAASIPCMGIEPTASTARSARDKGINVLEEFFDAELASQLVAEGKQADLIVANNVLAHVPEINQFCAGIFLLLKPNGVATFEFPHILRMVEGNQFDTIYHEHFSYLSFITVQRIFARYGLVVFDVEQLVTHGGSLRAYVQRNNSRTQAVTENVRTLVDLETSVGLTTPSFYEGFQKKIDRIKDDFLLFLLEASKAGKTVVAYGAAAKGNTLMNYAGVHKDLIKFVVDRNPAKRGKFMPGSRIPIVDETYLYTTRPDFLVVLPWNIKEEIIHQIQYIRQWGGKFVVAIPKLEWV